MENDALTARRHEIAANYGVHGHIHAHDFLFTYLSDHPHVTDPVQEYFSNGYNSVCHLRNILFNHLGKFRPDRVFSLLDFGSGYGMVARHYPVILPNARVTACDIHAEANAFNRAHLKIDTAPSSVRPEELILPSQFDVVFALSFFSHISGEFFGRWLQTLYAAVKDGGFLIFTTHGRFSTAGPIADDGVLFVPSSEQGDLDSQLYGTSFVSPNHVIGLIRRLDPNPRKVSLTLFREAFWWSHQDLYVIAKLADATGV